MGFSLYYTATRNSSLTEQENKKCNEIISYYCNNYPFRQKAEDFCIYSADNENRIIFNGATKLPNSFKMLTQMAEYWLMCLTEITGILSDADWNVRFDDVNLIFDDAKGWRFPTDEEYSNTKITP